MKKELAILWAAALRSGKYLQGAGQLFRNSPSDGNPEYCCLGVLGCLLELPINGHGEQFEGTADDDDSATYPKLFHKAGLDTTEQSKFIRMNDNEHKSFEQIATYIEETYIK